MPSTARPYQALRFVTHRMRCDDWLMICTLNPDTHSSISSHRSHSSRRTRIASVQLMLPWQLENRAACSMVSTFQRSTSRESSK